MSQAGIINLAGGGGGGSPVNTLTGDSGGAIPPTANNINILGSSGIVTTGSPGISTITISIQNSTTNQTVTSDGLGQTRTLSTISALAPGSYLVESRIAAFEPLTGLSAGWSLFALVNSVGGVAAVETDTDKISHIMDGLKEPTAVSTVDVNIQTLGSDIIIQVIGIATKTIDWGGFTVYVYRG